MPDYKNGKIYKLWSIEGDDIYIGSTINALHKRLWGHRADNNTCSSKILFEKYNDVKIELIEEYPCENKQQLNAREGHHMRLNKNNIINHCIAGRTIKEYNKKYYIDNIDKLKEQQNQYRIDNADKVKEYHKNWNIDNVEKIKKYNKQYSIDNKEQKKKNDKQYYIDNAEKIKQLSKKQYYLKKNSLLLTT